MSRRFRVNKQPSGLPFVQLYHHMLDSKEFARLSPGARALLLLFARRYNGHNNGNLEMTVRQFKAAGLGSEPTMRKYIAELVNGGWIVVTRYGGMRSGPNLYALTYLGIQDTNIAYDEPYRADTLPLHLWKDEKADQRATMRAPRSGSGLHRLRSTGSGSFGQTTNVVSFPSEREAA